MREDALRGTVADLIDGNLARTGELLEEAAKQDPRIAESIEAFHGSPHDVSQFDLRRIGTGEGAQAYGHGLYFAENEGVARGYAKSTSYRDFIRKVQELYDQYEDPREAAALVDESPDCTPGQRELVNALREDDWLGFDYPHQAVAAAISEPKNFDLSDRTKEALKNLGNLYKVHIKANPEHFLDWDKPFDEQSEQVQRVLKSVGVESGDSGKQIYQSLVKHRPGEGGGMTSAGIKLSDLDKTPEAVSKVLHQAGVPGVKYLDQGSRGKGDGTRNYVVFDDNLIRITHKNGQEVGFDEVRAADVARGGNVPPPDAEALKADWQRLADARRPDDEDLADSSREADRTPEPESIDPEKAPSAAEAAAREADALLADLLPRLTDEERQAFEEVLNRLDRDKAAEEQMVRDGVACLAAAEV